ncbi:MAG: fatty acid desaturase, partial [Deltaproteobacteria bacterium]|nr:fatty acid desaturase [Deltaproteobacteria bacterium]
MSSPQLLGALALIACYFTGALFGASLGYHRYLAHRSFEARRWFIALCVLIGLPAGTPAQWAGNHRVHHKHVDTPQDPHSPHHGGLWWAHCGWYLGTRAWPLCALYALAGPLRALFDAFWRPWTNQAHVRHAPDVLRDPLLGALSRPWVYTPLALLHWAGTGALSAWLVGEGWLWGWWLASVLVYNAGDAVDSAGHVWGENPYAGLSSSRAVNGRWLALLTFGDGWHANHHLFPGQARHGVLPG